MLGTTYMHSLLPMWCWAMLFAVVATHVALVARGRAPVAGALVAVLLVTVWTGAQFSINRQLGAQLQANPFLGLDVAAVLADPTPAPEPERCATLATLRLNDAFDRWFAMLTEEHRDRHGEPYCTQ